MNRATIPPRVAILLGLRAASPPGVLPMATAAVRPRQAPSSFYYSNGWYGDPYYHGYYPPGVVVVPPPVYPGQPGRPVSPEQPIARPPGGATTLPARPSNDLPGPSAKPAPSASTSSRSRMPSSQPRMSSSSRASIPRAPRGGGGRRR